MMKHHPEPEVTAGPSNEIVRFLVVPIVVTMLLAGGVYWLRETSAGSVASASRTVVTVHLLQHPSFDPIPVPETAHPVAGANVNARAERPVDQPESSAVEEAPSLQPTRAPPDAERHHALNLKAAPAPAASPPSSVVANFQRSLLRHIENHRRYPDAARRQRLQGTVQVLFVMRRNGAVLDAWVKTTSGQTVLDQEAVDTIRRAEPLPFIPLEMPDRLNIVLPVTFSLP